MDSAGTRKLCQTCYIRFNILGISCHHQVVQLVNNDHDLWKLIRAFALIALLHPFLDHMIVVSCQVSHSRIREELVPCIHLGYGPRKSTCCLLYIGNYRHYQVRYAVITYQLYTLGVDHDKLYIRGLSLVKNTHDKGIDTNRLT